MEGTENGPIKEQQKKNGNIYVRLVQKYPLSVNMMCKSFQYNSYLASDAMETCLYVMLLLFKYVREER